MTQGGGLLQLVAKGKQDVFLTGNPQVTWFKMVYRRYTNFAIESQIITFDNQPDFGRKITCILQRKGDLLGPLWLEVHLPALTEAVTGNQLSYVNAIAHALIQEVSIEIGSQEIDKQTGEWMEIWSNYTVTQDKVVGWNNLIGKVPGVSQGQRAPGIVTSLPTNGSPPGSGLGQFGAQTVYVPLRFWFCKNPGLYLPLLALQYHQVRLNITLRPLQEMFAVNDVFAPTVVAAPASIISMSLYGDYIHLDVEERRRFVANSHEYLIEQVQNTQNIPIDRYATTVQIPIEFNHPIRELYWVVQRDLSLVAHQWFNYTSLTNGEGALDKYPTAVLSDLILSAILRLDGFDRFDKRDASYFRLIQPFQFHTAVPPDDYIYSYSFCFRPEDVQPSGSMNASRIDTITLQLDMDRTVSPPPGSMNARVYGLNHNILRIVDGFGGLLFRM